MSPEWEMIVAEIEEKLLTLKTPELNTVCSALSLEVDKRDRDLPRKLRRLILQHVEGKDLTSQEDEGMSVLLGLNDLINELKVKLEDCNELSPENAVPEHHPVDKHETASETTVGQNEGGPLNATAAAASQNVSFAHPLYRRELKITGQIGEPNQKDKLTYSSLERQIQRAQKKGYDEGEIVEAVIQAIAPGTKLKSYLESRIDLTLQALRQILWTHYIEKDATELYHSLTRAAQES